MTDEEIAAFVERKYPAIHVRLVYSHEYVTPLLPAATLVEGLMDNDWGEQAPVVLIGHGDHLEFFHQRVFDDLLRQRQEGKA